MFISLEPVVGRYVTLQKLNEGDPFHIINWKEVIVDSVPANMAELETIKLAVDSSVDINKPQPQCSSSRPWAYKGGERCCGKGIFEDILSPVESIVGLINFDSTSCGGSNSKCSTPPCYNYNYQRLEFIIFSHKRDSTITNVCPFICSFICHKPKPPSLSESIFQPTSPPPLSFNLQPSFYDF